MEGSLKSNFPVTPTHGGRYLLYKLFGIQFEVSAKYRPPIMPIGRGAYGIVCSLMNSDTKEMVAIKKITDALNNEMEAKRTLREIKLLRHFDHENIIGIIDVIPPPIPSAFNDVYIAIELMDADLNHIIHSNQVLSEEHFQYILYQILRGLKYIHSANVIHRDLKPNNLLLNANCDLKICDFGLARSTSEDDVMTEYVVTRWYRAPELLLSSTDYTGAIDVWSVGCIFMELLNKQPLFPGKDQMNQMKLITELIGTPTESELGFIRSRETKRYMANLPHHPPQSLEALYPNINKDAIDLIERMLTFDPSKRITAEEALAHPYLQSYHDIELEPVCSKPFSFNFEQGSLTDEQIKKLIYKESLTFNPGYGHQIISDKFKISQLFLRRKEAET